MSSQHKPRSHADRRNRPIRIDHTALQYGITDRFKHNTADRHDMTSYTDTTRSHTPIRHGSVHPLDMIPQTDTTRSHALIQMTDPPPKKRCDMFPAIHGAPVTVICSCAPLSAPVRHVLTISWRTASLVSIK